MKDFHTSAGTATTYNVSCCTNFWSHDLVLGWKSSVHARQLGSSSHWPRIEPSIWTSNIPHRFSMVLSMVKSRFQPIAGASPQQALLGMMVLVVHSPTLGRWGKMAIFSHGEKMGKLWCTIDVGGFPDGSPQKKTKSDNRICWDRKGPQANQAPMPRPGDTLSVYHAQQMVNGKDWTASREKRVEVFNLMQTHVSGKYPQVQPDYIHRLNIKLLAMLWCPVFVFSAAVAPKPFSLHQCIVIARRLINSTTRKHWATWGSFG